MYSWKLCHEAKQLLQKHLVNLDLTKNQPVTESLLPYRLNGSGCACTICASSPSPAIVTVQVSVQLFSRDHIVGFRNLDIQLSNPVVTLGNAASLESVLAALGCEVEFLALTKERFGGVRLSFES